MAKKKGDRVAAVVKDVEGLAKALRADIKRLAKGSGLPKNLVRAAGQLRKRAASVTAQVEKYAHEARVELEGKKKKPARRRRKTTKTATRKK